MLNVVVIGAGVIGASVAFRLAEAGARVTVLEAGRVGGGTSGRSFAWINANAKQPRAYHDLNMAGMRAHAALREEFGELPWWHGGGCIEWCTDPAAQAGQRARMARLRDWGYAAEWIDASQLHELEPDLDLTGVGEAPIAWFLDESWLDPVVYAHAMLEAAGRHGARLRTATRVTEITTTGGRATGVGLANGERLAADVVVNCGGRWADTLAELAGPRLPLAPTAGLLVLTPPAATCLRRVVRAPRCHLRPDGAGRLMLHADDLDQQVQPEATPDSCMPLARELLARASEVVPGIGHTEPEAVRIGVRPIPADGLSAVGDVDGLAGYYVVVTHSGVTLAALLGRLAAQEILTGESIAMLAPFRPARLLLDSHVNP